jgi:putative NADH-flavin reductase
MSRLLILGATGAVGRHVLRQALAAGHEVTVLVRTPSKLPPEATGRVSVHTGDLSAFVPLDLIRGQEALINCAGHVADGDALVGLVDRLVTGVDSLPAAEQPVCWFLAGAALLDLDSSGRRGVDLPKVRSTYWPHRVNFERLSRSRLDWRLLCPGPMVDETSARVEPAAHLARHPARSRSRSRPCPAGPAIPAGLCVSDSPDDRVVRRCGCPHARQPRSRQRHVRASRRTGAARGHAGAEVAAVGQKQSSPTVNLSTVRRACRDLAPKWPSGAPALAPEAASI